MKSYDFPSKIRQSNFEFISTVKVLSRNIQSDMSRPNCRDKNCLFEISVPALTLVMVIELHRNSRWYRSVISVVYIKVSEKFYDVSRI